PLIARHLRGRPVTVITSNVAVLDELRDDDTVRLVLLGGVLRRNYRSLVGSLTATALRQVSADLLFLSCTGVRPNGHVVDDMAVEAPLKQAMVEAADKVVLVASDAKFPGTGSLRLCTLSDVDILVTTAGADPATVDLCRQAGGKVMVV
ncbi:MAG TPA: DeoR/GlpR family DNA-binding transcription regulator, partial [Pseudonocardiaceae bacterium]|nr:DeoR/GlpR family DNA-binding transcription regulator [Pseudonocardiaceae bacterium]